MNLPSKNRILFDLYFEFYTLRCVNQNVRKINRKCPGIKYYECYMSDIFVHVSLMFPFTNILIL